MSLTRFLKDKRNRNVFLEHLPKPTIETADLLQAFVPSSGAPALMASAFDFLLDLRLRQARGTQIATAGAWVPEHDLTALEQFALRDGFDGIQTAIESALGRARTQEQAFIASGKITEELLVACVDLAQIDVVFRAGYPPSKLGSASPKELDELRGLSEAANGLIQTHAATIRLRPTYGAWGELVGGVHSGVAFDGLLVDVKTVKEAQVKINDWLHICAELALADLARRDGQDAPEVTHIGIYLSRYGALWQMPAAPIRERPGWAEILRFMEWVRDNVSADDMGKPGGAPSKA